MKKTRLFSLIALVCVLVMSLSLFACHKHTHSEEWSSDAEYHWHAATCTHADKIADKAEHVDADSNEICDVCGYDWSEPVQPAEPTSIGTILSETANNTDVVIEATVFAVTSEGYFVNDGTGSIFVLTQTTQAVGDKVKIDGTFRLRNGQPIVAGYEVLAQTAGQTAIVPQEATIASIAVLNKEARDSYGKYLRIEAIVSVDGLGRYVLSDGTNSIIVNQKSNDEALASFVGTKVYLNVVTDGSSSEGWFVSNVTAESDIALVPVVIEDVKEEIFAQVTAELKTNVYTALALPTKNNVHPSVEFNWAVKSGTAISIANNVASVTSVEADEEVVLTLTISSFDQSASQDYTVVVKYIEAVELVNVPAITDPEKVISTQGQVVAVYGQHLVIHKEGNYLKVTGEEGEYTVGDEVTVFGTYGAIAYGFKGITAEAITVGSHSDVDFSTLTHVVLENEEDFVNLVSDYANQQVYFVKIVNPYVNLSGNTSYSWVRISGDSSRSKGYTIGTGDEAYTRIISLPLASLANNGSDFIAELEVPTLAVGASQRVGYTFYGFFIHAGSETWQFVLAEENGIVLDKREATDYEIKTSFPSFDVDALEAGNVALLRSGKYVEEITWSANVDGVIDVATGNYSALEYNKTVVLTASYVIGGETYTTEVELNFLAGGIEFKTVSEAIALGSGTYNVQAYVAANATTSENSANLYTGLILTDGVNTLYYVEAPAAEYTYTAGDLVQILGLEVTVVEGHTQTAQGGEFTLVSRENTIDYTNLNAVAITNEQQLIDYAAQSAPDKGIVIKFTGHFGLIGTGSTNCRMQLTYKEGVSGSAGARYAFADYTDASHGNRTFAINLAATQALLGENWWVALGLPENGGSGKLHYYTGTIYAVVGYNGNTMQAITVINAGEFSIAKDNAHQADYEVRLATPTDLPRGSSLPTSTTNVESITWECSVGSITINADGTFEGLTADTQATLTAIYMVGEVQCTTTIQVNFIYELPAITLAQALTKRGEVVKFTAQVLAVSINGAKALPDEAPNGFILSDGTNTIFYKTETIGDFKRGDNVVVNGATIVTGSNMAEGGSMSLESKGTVTIDYSTLVHTAVTSNEELVAYAAEHGLVPGSVLKITGTFYISGTSSKEADMDNWRGRLAMHTATGEKNAVYAWKDVATESAISLHARGQQINFANWVEDFGFKYPSSGTAYEIVGSVTLVYSETTSSRYSSWTIIDYSITTPATY